MGNVQGGNLALWLLVAVTAAVVITIMLGNAQNTAATGPDVVPWTEDHAAAMRTAAAEGKLVLVNFTADWCPPCQQMKAEVYSQQQIADAVTAGYVPLKVDMTNPGNSEQRIASPYGIEFLPTLLIVDAQGNELARQVGYVPDSQLRDWLGSLR